MPIWKSVSSSFGSVHGGIYERYPSFVGVSPQGFDHRSMMDPEPGRCRRTDGKKCRCSKNVIPDQKYCEHRMHRGCRHSRKPVEPSQLTLPDSTSSKNSNKVSENSKNFLAPVSSQHMNPSSCNTSTSHETTATAAMDSNNEWNNRNSISSNTTASTTITTATKNSNKSDCKRNKNSPITSEKGEEKLSSSDNNVINRSSKSGNKATAGNSMSPGAGFSPKSVLQRLQQFLCLQKRKQDLNLGDVGEQMGKDGDAAGMLFLIRNCARHMHRGARKHVEVSQPVAISTVGDYPPSGLTIANKAACAALSTSLSISIPSPPPIAQDEKSMSSSSETTISETTITASENGKLFLM